MTAGWASRKWDWCLWSQRQKPQPWCRLFGDFVMEYRKIHVLFSLISLSHPEVYGLLLCFLPLFSSACLHSAIPLKHRLFLSTHCPHTVCTLSAHWGWLWELPLHTSSTWTACMCSGCCPRASDESDVQTHTQCVGSASVCFSFDLDMIKVDSSLLSFPPFFLSLIWISLYFYSICPLLSLLPHSSLLFLSCLVFSFCFYLMRSWWSLFSPQIVPWVCKHEVKLDFTVIAFIHGCSRGI